MKEIFSMWKYGVMVAVTVLCAGIYMLLLLPTKAIPIIPGVTEIRPASLLPVLFGLLFGPAGAWGSAIGNLGGDLFGTLSIGSIFGFVGNFMYAYIPYKLWSRLKPKFGEDNTPTVNSAWKLAQFGIIAFIASAACAVIIAWGFELLGRIGFSTIAVIITLNNSVITLLLGPIILPILYRLAKKNKLLWTDIMSRKDISKPSDGRIHPLLVTTGSVGGLVIGLAAGYLVSGQSLLGHQLVTAGSGNLITALIILPFLTLIFYGSFNS
ncbi:MAG TPA: QueT transporter family protein [Clostridia bacterium]|nr:QueT transporter family protein [Clostridia bacterium]